MLVLLPPSETKRSGGDEAFDPASLSHAEALSGARRRVREALERLCRDEEAAARALKLGVKNRDEGRRNLELATSGAMPAVQRYTGVLYDALDVDGLDGSARAWIDEHVSVQSALFGLVSAADRVPAYRLSASTRLPSLGAPLKRIWAEAHRTVDLSAAGLVLDLRSKDYAALAPVPGAARLHVVQRSEGGETRALNHFNKAAKGDLVRRLAESGEDPRDLSELLKLCARLGLEVCAGPGTDDATLVTELGAPVARTGAAIAAG